MSSRTPRNLARWLTVVPAAFLFHFGAAEAADAQQHAQRLLLGVAAPAASVAPNTHRSVQTARPAPDAQQLARGLLLGATRDASALPGNGVPTPGGHRGHGDAQVLAQQVLLGHRAPT
jgi:hypothetical protein